MVMLNPNWRASLEKRPLADYLLFGGDVFAWSPSTDIISLERRRKEELLAMQWFSWCGGDIITLDNGKPIAISPK